MIAKENRFCTKCNQLDIANEFHFILKCPFHTDIHNIYIRSYITVRPSDNKLTQLLSSTNKVCNLGKYSLKANERQMSRQ